MSAIGKIISVILFVIIGIPFLVTLGQAFIHILPIIIGVVVVIGFLAMFAK